MRDVQPHITPAHEQALAAVLDPLLDKLECIDGDTACEIEVTARWTYQAPTR